jgi:predicted RNA-binding protein with PUA-like domain
MGFWLLKADPGDYGYGHLEKERRTVWDGVSNNLALKHIRAARKGDLALIYHTGGEKAVVGLAEIVSDPYTDPRGGDERLQVFDLRARRRLAQPVSLSAIRADSRFADFPLVRMPRLSVMPVPGALWKRLLAMAGEKK